ncbi:hypothetical protein FGADI_5782 [Fusarium gaditjirri]|uniref:Uncharacterized protein n=1 Tax=Fusarium gaditjirri TaxID=282569 RepID=A0A8H4T9M5_9HYPO|nr:hypothetical protein FGADI_5782 [Fusarium gaditjirri]
MPPLLTFSVIVGTIMTSVVADIYNVNVPSGFFPGPQAGIGSWYRASAGQDSTNGKSWCGYTYFNSDPVFAPSLEGMGGATYNSNPDAWREQTRKHCGLEAKVTDPTTGKSQLMYIGDSFDDTWFRVNIDIMIDAYSIIHGNPNGDKNNVIKGVQWELTGRVNTKYAAPGAFWPPTSGGSGSGSGAGGLGAKCDGQTQLCNSGLTCLSPDGVCSDKACNWGCQGWSCSSSVPCQKPWNCASGVCSA